MITFKRNQVEEAISRYFGQGPKPSSKLHTRIKRLLDMDRNLGRNPRSSDPEKANYAFYSDVGQGKGIEAKFSEFEVFAVQMGLRFLEHEWPQEFAVNALRRVRKVLEAEHAEIMKLDPSTLFDPTQFPKGVGMPVVYNANPAHLVIVTRQDPSVPDNKHPPFKVCWGHNAVVEFAKRIKAQSYSGFELVTAAHRLSAELQKVQPRKRGRGA